MRILFVQTSFLGDVVLSTPVIAGLHQVHPEAEIWAMTTPGGKLLVERDPLLAGVLVFDKRGKHAGLSGFRRMVDALASYEFDAVYSLHRSWRTACLLRMSKIPRRVGFREASGAFFYTETTRRKAGAPEHDVLRNLRLLTKHGALDSFSQELRLFAPDSGDVSPEVRRITDGEPYTVLVPGSAWNTKRWEWRGYRALSQSLERRGQKVVVLGSQDEMEICRLVAEGTGAADLSGRTRLDEVLRVIQHASLVVCNDSFALHVASAFKRPTVVIFCSTTPDFGFGPWRNRAVILEVEGLHCRPCGRHGGKTCPTGTERCMKGIRVQDVMDACDAVLADQGDGFVQRRAEGGAA